MVGPWGAREQPGLGWAVCVGISQTQSHILSRAQPWPGWELTINPYILSALEALTGSWGAGMLSPGGKALPQAWLEPGSVRPGVNPH